MKKILALFSLLLISVVSSAQYYDGTHFNLSLSLGRGNQIAKTAPSTALGQSFYEQLEKGTVFDIGFAYYLRKGSSLGLEAYMDLSIGRASVVIGNGALWSGDLMQMSLGLMLAYRWIADKHTITLGLGLAPMAYLESGVIDGSTYTFEESTDGGIPAKFKYEYSLSKTISLGVNAAAYLGSAYTVRESENGVYTETKLDDPNGMARWSITVGPRFHF